jgi:hypothetical protein
MASNLDDIIRQALKAGKSAAKKTGKKTGSVSREARKAANKAEAASTRAAKTEASKQAREARRGWNRRNFKQVTDTAVSQRYGTGEYKLGKAKENFATDIERFNKVIEATNKELRRGVDSPQLDKIIRNAKTYAEKEGYTLDASDIKAITQDHMGRARRANMTAKRNLRKVMRKYTEIEKEGGQKALVDEGARRALRRESKGQSLVKEVGDDRFAKEREVNKRLEKLERDRKDKKRLSQATSKMRGSSGPRKKTTKKVSEQESSKRLRRAQEANAKDVVDPRVKKMSPEQYKRFRKREDENWKRLRSIPSPSNKRGMSSKESEKRLKELGDQSLNRRREPKLPPVKRTIWVRNKEGKLVPKPKRK